MAAIIIKRRPTGNYTVYAGDRCIGAVKKVSHWTVRGQRITWDALVMGRVVGCGLTRKEAINLLALGANIERTPNV